jgi:adenosylhomocysteine nucleosidase
LTMHCGAQRSGSGQTGMPPKPLAIVAAMPVELAPIIGRLPSRSIGGVDLYELPNAIVAVGGIGAQFARRATEVVIEYAQPRRVISAGLVGAVSPKLKVGDVARIREVIDATAGTRYPGRDGKWILVTSARVSSVADKQRLLARHGADVVDMEAAAVAEVAREHGMEFASVKAVSDEASFLMPPMTRFIGSNGRFATARFVFYIAFRPHWWATVGELKRNSDLAAKNLCAELNHLMESSA